MRKIVVIGGSAAGMMSAVSAARCDNNAQVSIVTKDGLAYRRPAIPALISGYIAGPEGASIFSEQTLTKYNVKLICPAEAAYIETDTRTITVKNNKEQKELAFDTAIIATGGLPLIAPIKGAQKKGVCTFTTYEAASQIVQRAKSDESAVVIGAGFIALEIAEALMNKGLKVYFNVRSRILRKLVEPDVSKFLSQHFEKRGLKMLTGEAISEIAGDKEVEYVVHKGKKISTKLVIMGTGVKPNVSLAEKSGVELGESGAIKVDKSMQTSVEGIYAAGDCAESPDLSTGKFVYLPVGSIGACAGNIAGKNAAGAGIETDGFLRAQADEILGMQIFTIGHSTTSAKQVSLEAKEYDLDAPKGQEVASTKPFEAGKILTDKKDRIVGAQLVARRHGSQIAYQLYQAVVEGEKRRDFLNRFKLPRVKFAEAFMQAAKSDIWIKQVGEAKALTLSERLSR